MFNKRVTPCIASILILSTVAWAAPRDGAQLTRKPFSVADDIGMTLFRMIARRIVQFSPDGNYFAVYGERGRLDLNRPEDSLRFYRSKDVEDVLNRSKDAAQPLWVVSRSTDIEGPLIIDWRWLADSSGVAFLERAAGSQHIALADLRKKKIETLTSPAESVTAFDIRDRRHFVYAISGSSDREKLQKQMQAERAAPAVVGTGRSLFELILPDDPQIIRHQLSDRNTALFAGLDGKHIQVKANGAPIVPGRWLALSPDGQSLVTEIEVPEVPVLWETLYPPPFESYPVRIRAGRNSASHYVRINLRTGSVQSLTDAPESARAGWETVASPTWSSDGQAILLPGTFLHSKDQMPSRPCVAVVDVESNTPTCVEMLKGVSDTGREEGYHLVEAVRFIDGDKHRVLLSYYISPGNSVANTEYRRMADGSWQIVAQSKGDSQVGHDGLEIDIDEAFDRSPMLVARREQASRVIWDPNPQLRDIDLGQASVYKWKDKEGKDFSGSLHKPSNYKLGQRYPLVIQTHGFEESVFVPAAGGFTAAAARELATSGIVVLQIGEGRCVTQTPSEGPCAVAAYEAAAKQLVSEGVVDPNKIGIIGFSRTCFYVMEILTTAALRFKAASITDGVMQSYLQYLMFGPFKDMESMNGGKPFGEGLQQWLKTSPGFNLEKVNTPLLVNAEGRSDVLFMWEPYAGLRFLHKPVDLVVLNTDEHILTNPAVRLASQGGSVDWFRFWLQDYEDSNPAKAEQYKRWRELRKLQQAIERK